MKRFRVAHQEGPYRIHAEVLFVGDDLVVSMWVDGDQAQFQTKNQNGDVVIDQGVVKFG